MKTIFIKWINKFEFSCVQKLGRKSTSVLWVHIHNKKQSKQTHKRNSFALFNQAKNTTQTTLKPLIKSIVHNECFFILFSVFSFQYYLLLFFYLFAFVYLFTLIPIFDVFFFFFWFFFIHNKFGSVLITFVTLFYFITYLFSSAIFFSFVHSFVSLLLLHFKQFLFASNALYLIIYFQFRMLLLF